MAEFVTPDFLQNSSVDEVHAVMKSILPADLDLSEGGHAWNMTRPTALVVAELREFILPEVIKLIFPEFSYGEFVDAHAKARSMTRRVATAASGEITITGAVGSIIPSGSIFSTAAINDEPSVDYATLSGAVIPDSGSVTVPIQCTQTGTVGNTTANTIVLVASRLTGVTAVTNEEDVTGGTEEETDASLIERILEYDRSQANSYTGCVADYKRWATSVPGVGEATVVPAGDDTGLVTIIITDSNGAPASSQLCESVYNYIMRPDAPGERLAPVNAYLRIAAPETIEIGIAAEIEIEATSTIESVKTAYWKRLTAYLATAMEEEEVKYTRLAAALSATDGVYDFDNLQVGVKSGDTITYGTGNIPITYAQLATIAEEDIVLTVSSVHGSTSGIGSGYDSTATVVKFATLDANGKVTASQLPDYLDDVIEGYYSGGTFYADEGLTKELVGETGKIYMDISSDTQSLYRYNGTSYVAVSGGGGASYETLTGTEIEQIYDES